MPARVCQSARAAQPTSKITLVAVGDICLANGVQRAMDQKGRGYPFAGMKSVLRKADIAFGNLECVLADGGIAVAKQYSFRAKPRCALAEAGFDVLSLANNHTLDYGRAGLAETVGHLQRNRLACAGAGLDLAEARKPRIMTVRGTRIRFLA